MSIPHEPILTAEPAAAFRYARVSWVVGFVVAVTVTVWSHQVQWEAEPVLATAYSLIGLGWLGTASLLWRQPDQASNARMFLLVAVVWIVGEVSRRDIDALYQPTLFFAQYTQILAASLILRYPRKTFDRLGLMFFLSGLGFTTLFAVPLVLLAPGPGRPGDAPGRLLDSLGPYRFGDVQYVRSIYWCVYAVLFLTLFVLRWRRLTRFERRTLTPILYAAIAVAVTIGAAVVEPALSPSAARALRLARGLAGVAVSVGFLASAGRLRMARATVADLVERIQGPVSERSVRDALVAVFGDESIEVRPWTSGAAVRTPSSGLALPIPGSDGQPLAVAVFPTDLRRHTSLLRSHLAACGLALENARQLQAVHDARVRLLQASREERQRLESDLHDGAQQRLLALGMQLGVLHAKADTPEAAHALSWVRDELHEAQRELRELAQGIYPAVLIQAGLGPALESVVERHILPFVLSVPARRWDRDIESALYLVACEAVANVVKHADASKARIEVREVAGDLELRVDDDGRGFIVEKADGNPARPILGTVSDRVEALGGTLLITSTPGRGTSVRARVPLITGDDYHT